MKNFTAGFAVAAVLLYGLYLLLGSATVLNIDDATSTCFTAMADNPDAAPGSDGEKLVKEKCARLMHKVYKVPAK